MLKYHYMFTNSIFVNVLLQLNTVSSGRNVGLEVEEVDLEYLPMN